MFMEPLSRVKFSAGLTPLLLQLSHLSKGPFCDVNQKLFNYVSENWFKLN